MEPDTKKTRPSQKRGLLGRLLKILMRTAAVLAIGLTVIVAAALTQLYFYANRDLPGLDEIRAGGCLPVEGRQASGYRPLPLAEMPPLLPKAFLAMEDADFYNRKRSPGFWSAVYRDFRCASGRLLCCDSAISRQVARQCRSSAWTRHDHLVKVPALIRRLEAGLDRDELLEVYLNQVYLGRGAYGVTAAARNYFGKSPAELSPAEIALLTTAVRDPKGPDSRRAEDRLSYALTRLVDMELISEDEARAAREEKISFKTRPSWPEN